jgi:hypothetical protein
MKRHNETKFFPWEKIFIGFVPLCRFIRIVSSSLFHSSLCPQATSSERAKPSLARAYSLVRPVADQREHCTFYIFKSVLSHLNPTTYKGPPLTTIGGPREIRTPAAGFRVRSPNR